MFAQALPVIRLPELRLLYKVKLESYRVEQWSLF